MIPSFQNSHTQEMPLSSNSTSRLNVAARSVNSTAAFADRTIFFLIFQTFRTHTTTNGLLPSSLIPHTPHLDHDLHAYQYIHTHTYTHTHQLSTHTHSLSQTHSLTHTTHTHTHTYIHTGTTRKIGVG